MSHIIANITWQDDYWNGNFTEADAKRSSFRYVQGGNLPHERWNFNLSKNVSEGLKTGFFQTRGQPQDFTKGGLVFFASRHGGASYVVGLYAGAELGSFELEPDEGVELKGNVRAPVKNVFRWDEIDSLPLNPPRHLNKKRIGQANFNKLDNERARNILTDAIAAHGHNSEKQARLRQVLELHLEPTSAGQKRPKQYFIEITTRTDEERDEPLGVAMRTPQAQTDGRRHPSYTLLTKMEPDDVVLHVRNLGSNPTLEGVSLVRERYQEAPKPSGEPGYLVYNKDYQLLETPIERQDLLEHAGVKLVLRQLLDERTGPFFIDKNLQPLQGWSYSSAPLALVKAWNERYRARTGKDLPHVSLGVQGEERLMDDTTKHLLELSRLTRNLILYGPPGTGKTFAAKRFVEALVESQLDTPLTGEQRYKSATDGLKWFEAIALALFELGANTFHSLSDIYESKLLAIYAAGTASKDPNATTRGNLQYHTSPENEYVNIAERHTPYLFEKNAERQWGLSDEGRAYVEAELQKSLKLLSEPKSPKHTGIEDFSEFVTFHQSFAYEDFIEGLKPVLDNEEDVVRYEVSPGVFRAFCEQASLDEKNKYVFIIDEINRANISKVLGELITLLEDDKRAGEANAMKTMLPYSKKRFSVPANLFVVGTMNTTDRSIALLDVALRRRFAFVEFLPKPALLEPLSLAEGDVQLGNLLRTLNRRIVRLLDKHHQIGHSYLLGLDSLEALSFAWYHRIVPLIEEYFYNDGGRLQEVLGNEFISLSSEGSAEGEDYYGQSVSNYSVKKLEGMPFVEALNQLASSDS